MLQEIRKLLGRTYQPLNKIHLSKSKLIHNYHYLTSLSSSMKVAPVLKSNAYGHGIKPIAQILDKMNPPFFCVDSLYEAYELLKAGIKTKVLIMGYVHPANISVKHLPFSYAVYDMTFLERIAKQQPHAGIHLFVDTGMHREGILIDSLPQFVDRIKASNLKLEGVMSHFAQAEETDNKLTIQQIQNFERAQEIVHRHGFDPEWIHIAASGGLLNRKKFSKYKLGNLARVGLASYGIDPAGKDKNLKPVLKLTTVLSQIKEIKKGEKIGYDFTYTATRDIKTAILPIGYNDGVEVELSNRGRVMIGNKLCPIIGRLSMNITTIDVSHVNKPHSGQEVIVYSDNPADQNSIEHAAYVGKTMPYELLVHLNPSMRREIVA